MAPLMTPRAFVQTQFSFFASIGNPSWYTVVPLVKNRGLLDYSFHIDRLVNCHQLLYDADDVYAASRAIYIRDDLRIRTLQSIRTSLFDYAKGSSDTFGPFQQIEGSVTVVAGYSSDKLSVNSFFSPCSYDRSSGTEPYYVDVFPYTRQLPQAKLASWPIERQFIEQQRHPDARETLLLRNIFNTAPEQQRYGQMFGVSEGLISNVFIVIDTTCIDDTSSTSSRDITEQELLTAPADCVLEGSTASVVRRLCSAAGVTVQEDRLPDVRDFRDWRGMFLTSAVKGIQRVDGMLLPTAIVSNRVAVDTIRDDAAGKYTSGSIAIDEADSSLMWMWDFRKQELLRLKSDVMEAATIDDIHHSSSSSSSIDKDQIDLISHLQVKLQKLLRDQCCSSSSLWQPIE